jgi:hypothetical protein
MDRLGQQGPLLSNCYSLQGVTNSKNITKVPSYLQIVEQKKVEIQVMTGLNRLIVYRYVVDHYISNGNININKQ